MQYSYSNSNSNTNGQAMVSRPASLHSDISNGPSNPEGERPRKRVRKGTRSCWECKRRKVRCQLSSEDVPVCSGCLARGTTCLSQEYPEERDASNGTQVGERLGRVEKLLETLVAKISAYDEEEKSQKILTPESIGGDDVLSPFSTAATAETSPFNSLFDNTVIGRRDVQSQITQITTPAPKSTRARTPSGRKPKLERLRQTLVDLLPTQEDTDLICAASNCWLLIHALSCHAASVVDQNQDSIVSSAFNLSEVSKKHPALVARTLMYIAVCLQQLDPSFDTGRLHLLPTVDARVEKYLTTIQALITSDDELVTTMEGLECLLLQGAYYINAGSPRRAWLTFRRALNVGLLMGIHKKVSANAIPGGREMWFQIVQADRYLALLLGLPAGSSDDKYEPDENFQNPEADRDLLFTRKLCDISTRIIERNQAENSHAYAATQEIDEKLDALAKEMPQSWWDIPTNIADDHSSEAASHFDRLMTQIWFYQLQGLLHLPFMLRASMERRYDYSKFSCLKASREMMWRYLAMRSADNKSFGCKVVDFGALTATVALFLGLLQPANAAESRDIPQQRDSDRALIHMVLHSMEELAENGRDIVAAQSVNVIKSLLAVDPPSGENGGNLRLTIPYFGTISIVRPAQTPAQDDGSNVPIIQGQQSITVGQQGGAAQTWQGMQFPPMNFPTVSFTSSQFPPLVAEQPSIGDLGWEESDTLFFDSLLNTDIEGNWIF